MSKPRLLDLFCKAGGCTRGYQLAGFHVTGVDIEAQPRYVGDEFVQLDVLELDLEWVAAFDAIHASPPCQAFTKAQRLQGRAHPDLIAATRALLKATGLPYVIENVPGAPLIDPAVLEGQMFSELRTHRPRWFECSFPVSVPFMRGPRPAPNVKMGRKAQGDEWIQVVGHFTDVQSASSAMGIDWMTRDELSQAIPPVYTRLIGRALLEHLAVRATA